MNPNIAPKKEDAMTDTITTAIMILLYCFLFISSGIKKETKNKI
ncbi:MAG: hypothetical protein WC726_01955 [Parcubacteria group bacterium]